MRKILAVSLLTIGISAFAEDKPSGIKIRQVSPERNQVAVQSEIPLTVGTELIATFVNGHQCALKVISGAPPIAIADASGCKNAQELVAGQTLEISLFEDQQTSHQSAAKVFRDISDLQYQPDHGKLAAMIQYSSSVQRGNFGVAESGVALLYTKTSIESYDLQIGYGLTDQVSVGLGAGWIPYQNEADTYAAASSLKGENQFSNSNGLKNPTLQGQFRVLEQTKYPLTLDAKLAYSVNAGSATTATAQTNGNVLRGGDLTAFELSMSRKDPSVSYVFSLTYLLYGIATSNNPDTSAQSQTNSFGQFNLTIGGQYHVMERLFLRGLFTSDFVSSQAINVAGTRTSISAYNQPTIEGALLYSIVPKHYLISLGLQNQLPTPLSGSIGSTTINADIEVYNGVLSLIAEF